MSKGFVFIISAIINFIFLFFITTSFLEMSFSDNNVRPESQLIFNIMGCAYLVYLVAGTIITKRFMKKATLRNSVLIITWPAGLALSIIVLSLLANFTILPFVFPST